MKKSKLIIIIFLLIFLCACNKFDVYEYLFQEIVIRIIIGSMKLKKIIF